MKGTVELDHREILEAVAKSVTVNGHQAAASDVRLILEVWDGKATLVSAKVEVERNR